MCAFLVIRGSESLYPHGSELLICSALCGMIRKNLRAMRGVYKNIQWVLKIKNLKLVTLLQEYIEALLVMKSMPLALLME